MNHPRFLADHDLHGRIIDGVLRRAPAAYFARLRHVMPPDTHDPDVLAFAAAAGLIVVSHDVNTITAAAHARIAVGHPMPGLVLARQSLPVRAVIDDLLLLWTASEAPEWHGRVLFLPV